MGQKYELFRIYVWFNAQESSWASEGKWWREDEHGGRNLLGTIGQTYVTQQSVSSAVDEILQAADDMNIVVKNNIRLDYSEKFEYWDEAATGMPNPFPKPECFEELVKLERAKRNW